jgi:hypothetical protein
MQQLGHTDPAFTLRVYAHAMRRSQEERERLKGWSRGTFGQRMCNESLLRTSRLTRRPSPEWQKAPHKKQGFPKSGRPDLNRGPHRPE